MAITIIGLSVLFFLGHALNWVFIKTKVPDLLILVALGYILGPVLDILSANDFGKVGSVLSTLALIVILYEGGLHLKTKDLLTGSLPAAGLSLLGFVSIATLATLAAKVFSGQPWSTATLLGVGIGSTSSAIVIPMVKNLSIKTKTKTILSLESAFTDVLAIVIFLVLVEGAVAGSFQPMNLLVGLGPNTLLAALWGLGSGLLWAFVKKRFAPLLAMAFAGEAWALLTYGIIEFSGLNGAIGVLALGFMLANLDLVPQWLKRQLRSVPVSYADLSILSELTFLLRTFFFIYLGLLIKFSSWQSVLLAFVLTLFILVTRFFSVRAVFHTKSWSALDVMVATAMGPRGLACAVLATIPVQRNIAGGVWIQEVIFAVIPMTILCTAVLVWVAESQRMRQWFRPLFNPYPDAINAASSDPSPSTHTALKEEH